MQPHLRWMLRCDMPQVLGIERSCFEFPWDEDAFIMCLRQRNCVGMVATTDDGSDYGKIVGFMIYELHKMRLHVLNFAVANEARRQKVGEAMAKKLAGKLSWDRRNRIMLEVRETNVAAQLFWRSQGYKAISVLRNYYVDTAEDAYLMRYRHVATVAETFANKLMDLRR